MTKQVKCRAQVSPGGLLEDWRKGYGKNGTGCAPQSTPFTAKKPLGIKRKKKNTRNGKGNSFPFCSVFVAFKLFSGHLKGARLSKVKHLKALFITHTTRKAFAPLENHQYFYENTKSLIIKKVAFKLCMAKMEIRGDISRRKINLWAWKVEGTGLNEQMRDWRFTRGKGFSAGRNDFPFNTTCTAGGGCTQLHRIRLWFRDTSDSRLSFALPPRPTRPSLQLLHASCTACRRAPGRRQPESRLIPRKRSHLARTNSVPRNFASSPNNST